MSVGSGHRGSVGLRAMLVAGWLGGLALTPGRTAPAAVVDYSREVRPILSRHCFKCHGPDEKARKARLRLDIRDDAVRRDEDGQAAVVPGAPDRSELVARVFSTDPDDVMPPPGAKLELSEKQRETLRRWVSDGAVYQEHWAFVPPQRPAVPKVRRSGWDRNPIDAFILRRMQSVGLKPSPEAARSVLIRRVSLDLVGLPPTPEAVAAFEADWAEGAYERLVDRLLAAPQYGERWARRWLDLARYADTNGYEKDRPRSMWPWRDWVVEALNRDLPFDQFTVEQLAGDLLPGATRAQRLATGFHRNTMINEEGGIDPLEYRFYSVVDRVAVTGTTWLGLTVGCAQCHTHKFDPLTQREYYGLMAFLDNADEPELELEEPAITARRRETDAKIEALLRELPGKWPIDDVHWVTPAVVPESTAGASFEPQDDGSWWVTGPAVEQDTTTLTVEPGTAEIRELRLEALPDPRSPSNGPGRSEHGNFVLSEASVRLVTSGDGGGERVLPLAQAVADAAQKDFPAAQAIDGDLKTGWAVHVAGEWHVRRTLRLVLAEPLRAPVGSQLRVRLDQQFGSRHTLGRVRLSLGEALRDPRPREERRAAAYEAAYQAWWEREAARTVDWEVVKPVSATSEVPYLTVESDGSVFATGDMTKSDTYVLRFRGDFAGVRALRLEALADPRLPRQGPGRTFYEGPRGDFFLSEVRVAAGGQPVPVASATESFARVEGETRFRAALALDGDAQSGWSVAPRFGEDHHAVFVLEPPLPAVSELEVRLLFERYHAAGLGRLRLAVTRDERPALARELPPALDVDLRRPARDRTAEADARLRRQFLSTALELAPARQGLEAMQRSRPEYPTTLVVSERPPENPRATLLRHRGEYLQPGERVPAALPSFLPGLPAGEPTNRLGFARWVVSRANPLTSRVAVNRQWAALFGRGLVRTVEDFGLQGEWPSHPELLDWLALEFMDQGWSMKRLHRLLVTSATYRQSSRSTPAQLERDPENLWWSHGPRFRVEAEMVRDAALRSAGLLSLKRGGPSVFPPQPAGVSTEGAYGPLEWTVSEGEDRYRRGLYTFMKRTAPYAMFSTFDAPSGEACVARRDVSNTPLQALTLLNDAVLQEAAQALGRQVAAAPGDDRRRIEVAYLRVLGRAPARAERSMVARFVAAQRERFRSGAGDPGALAGSGVAATSSPEVVERAVWTAVARALINTDEFITKS